MSNKSVVAVLMAIGAQSAQAGTLKFDCDVPPNNYSSVDQDFSQQNIEIRGLVLVRELRAGQFLPVAGARIFDIGEKNSLGFQLIAPSRKAKELDLTVHVKLNGISQSYSAGTVIATDALTFRLTTRSNGKAEIALGNSVLTVDFVPPPNAIARVFCSTGQFKFSELVFTEGPAQ